MRKCKTLIKYFHLKNDVITILKLRTGLVEKAVKLTHIKADTNVSKEVVNIAFNLYEELQKIDEPKKFKFYHCSQEDSFLMNPFIRLRSTTTIRILIHHIYKK